jgi:hypothetical protein
MSGLVGAIFGPAMRADDPILRGGGVGVAGFGCVLREPGASAPATGRPACWRLGVMSADLSGPAPGWRRCAGGAAAGHGRAVTRRALCGQLSAFRGWEWSVQHERAGVVGVGLWVLGRVGPDSAVRRLAVPGNGGGCQHRERDRDCCAAQNRQGNEYAVRSASSPRSPSRSAAAARAPGSRPRGCSTPACSRDRDMTCAPRCAAVPATRRCARRSQPSGQCAPTATPSCARVRPAGRRKWRCRTSAASKPRGPARQPATRTGPTRQAGGPGGEVARHLRGKADALHPPGECAGCDACQPVRAAGQFTGQNAKFSGPPGGTARTRPAALRHRLVAGYVTGQ